MDHGEYIRSRGRGLPQFFCGLLLWPWILGSPAVANGRGRGALPKRESVEKYAKWRTPIRSPRCYAKVLENKLLPEVRRNRNLLTGDRQELIYEHSS